MKLKELIKARINCLKKELDYFNTKEYSDKDYEIFVSGAIDQMKEEICFLEELLKIEE